MGISGILRHYGAGSTCQDYGAMTSCEVVARCCAWPCWKSMLHCSDKAQCPQDDDYDTIPWGVVDGPTLRPLGGRRRIRYALLGASEVDTQVRLLPVYVGTVPVALSIVH